MLEAFWIQKAVERGECLNIPRIAIYVAPGFTDLWAVRWELFHYTFRGESRRAIIICIGSGAQTAIYNFCQERGLSFHHEAEVPTMDGLTLRVKPVLLIAMDKGKGVVSKYADEVEEKTRIPVLRRIAPAIAE